MTNKIFQFRNNVTVLGGGESRTGSLSKALALAPTLIAADGGASRALSLGHMPELVVGDMDSLDDSTKAALPQGAIYKVCEQDSTDFEKVLQSVRAPLLIGVGFMGARLDHELACYSALMKYAHMPCILLGETDLCFHAPPQFTISLPVGSRVSLFPLAKVTVTASGLVFPVKDMPMRPGGRIGTSNMVSNGGQVQVSVDQAGLLVILPRAALAAAVRALGKSGHPVE
ncbi:MAG TPA: thiamine diphosphokinase [Aliiroseovarius sp.]|nr:thiamine diphosphokinase [Aliiroseovarius sp.]